ncbi:MAG: hypothetical protein DBY41_04190 [Clostridium sp.]|nr:MAG: hypothetical protein DBY41_04190 [Clostridium sp.]
MGDKLMAVAWDVNGIREDIQLVSVLGSGGEGDVYITDTPGIVAKIYKLSKNPSEAKATENKYNKVRKLIDMRLQCEGVCFPLKMVTSRDGRFIGYTMTQAKGDTLSDVIHPMVIKNEFPNMERLQLVDICIDILEKVEYLHKHGIVMCDINLGNILVSGIESDNIKTSFVDTDSYQIGDLLGEVGVPIFTPPELHGVKLETVKRTYQNEYFSIATLLFMIMMPGQKPYARIGGTGSVAENIRTGIFPYAKGGEYSGQYAPNQMYRHIWSHLAYKNYFWETFHKDGNRFAPEKRISVSEWLKYFRHYRQLLTDSTIESEDPEGLKVFPAGYKRTKQKCKLCSREFLPDKPSDLYCEYCRSNDEVISCDWCEKEFMYTMEQQAKDEKAGRPRPTLCPRCRDTHGICDECGEYFTKVFKSQTTCDKCSVQKLRCQTCGRQFDYTFKEQTVDHKYGRQKPTECSTCRSTKPCPICKSTRIPKSHSYCKTCREKPAEYRECVNCHKQFSITYGQRDWEQRKDARIKQCPVCKAAHCTSDPCTHSEEYQARQRARQEQINGEKQAKQAAQQKQSSNSGCYIATAVYGSYTHPQTMVLRAYRDGILLKNPFGRAFVRAYYATSPTLVKYLGDTEWFKRFWRARLDRMVEKIKDKYGY